MMISDKVRSFVCTNFYVPDTDSLCDQDSLLEAGIVDSTGVVELIGFLETEFCIRVEDAEIIAENVDSIERITAFVARKMAAAAPTHTSQTPYGSDGLTEFVDRLDDQVEIASGVGSGEIETAIRAIHGVDEACVLTDRDEAGTPRLTAYVGASRAAAVTSAGVREELKQTLPPYMVPAAIVVLGALPTSANGMVDRAALRTSTVRSATPSPGLALPRDPLEAMLVDIWERLLNVHPIGIRDDFFDLGGHALLAARMINEVEQAAGRRVALPNLPHHVTVESLANALVNAEYLSRQSRIVRLNEHGTRRPLFFLHGDLNGGGFYTRRLARHLGAEWPLLVADPAGVTGGFVPATIEAMAAIEVDCLRAVQPRGPYLLGGHCNGGLVALEMARQLRADGDEVLLVVLASAWAASTRLRLLDGMTRAWAKWRGMSEQQRVDLFVQLRAVTDRLSRTAGRERFMYVTKKIGRLLKRANSMQRCEGRDEQVATHSVDIRFPELYAVYHKAVEAYVPGRYEGRVALLLTGDLPGIAAQAADWRRAIPRLELHRIEGEHMTCITTHVGSLAATLRECLASVEESELAR